jgi:hypothetical protein
MRLNPEDDFGSTVFGLTAARLQPGTPLLVEVSRRRWVAPGSSWHGQPLVRPVANRHATSTTVRRIERESTVLSVGTATEVIVWTDHGVLVCTPSTVLHSPKRPAGQ